MIIGNVSFILDRSRQKVLLLKRAKDPMRGFFTGVGGKAHPNESMREAALREIQEESGLEVKNLCLKAVIKTLLESTNTGWLLFVYVAEALSDDLIRCPEGDLQWVDLKNLSEIPLIGFIKLLIPAVLNCEGVLEGTVVHTSIGDVLYSRID